MAVTAALRGVLEFVIVGAVTWWIPFKKQSVTS